ncbi:Dihydropteroate synthase-like protein [Abortiporus biennis]|nr:Dihydropteroate synthase-like protein [Abortiporus biennis]
MENGSFAATSVLTQPNKDVIRVRNLSVIASFNDGAQWPSSNNKSKSQPLNITLTIVHDITKTAETDDLVHSIDYSSICKTLVETSSSRDFNSIECLTDYLLDQVLSKHQDVEEISISVTRTRALLHPAATRIRTSRRRPATTQQLIGQDNLEEIGIIDLECRTIVGINPCEREESQIVTFDILLIRKSYRTVLFNFRALANKIYSYVTDSKFYTLEALASSVARVTLEFVAQTGSHHEYVNVRAGKRSALVLADAAEVEVTRSLHDGMLVPYQTHRASSTVAATSTQGESSSSDSEKTLLASSRISKITSSQPSIPTSASGTTVVGPVEPSSKPASRTATPVSTSSSDDTSAALSALASSLTIGDNTRHKAAIALGSNLGDRFHNIELALRLFEADGIHYSRLTSGGYVNVIDTSFMYETEPMYVLDQPKFINCTCMVETNLSALELLTLLKRIETIVGRVTSFRNGPRAIDLDILLYDSQIIDTRPINERTLDNLEGHLVVPHPRMLEREFVLRPLHDMIPEYVHPISKRTIQELFTQITRKTSEAQIMYKVIPFPRYPLTRSGPSEDQRIGMTKLPEIPPVPATATYWKFPVVDRTSLKGTAASSGRPRKTYIMGTLNVTPDSFSDGAVHNSIPAALAYARASVAGGADVIDIGGYSTRPGAAYVSPEEELTRVVPVVQAIRTLGQYHHHTVPDDPELDNSVEAQARRVMISVDTFRWEVAEEAIHAGANCINDVYAFSGPGFPVEKEDHFFKMRQVARDLAVPVILMHSRGEASFNKDYTAYNYALDSNGRGAVIEGVKVELGKKVDAAVQGKGGLRRWYVIVDPGIGFSKTVEGNLEVLRNASAITELQPPSGPPLRGYRNPLAGYPLLIGASRKSFLAGILEQPDTQGTYAGRDTQPKERGWATAAAVACAVQQKAAVVRVHDVLGKGDVVRVASALWG